MRRAVNYLYSHPNLTLLLLLLIPMAWLLIFYLGSLSAMVVQSFYTLDDFSGRVIPEFSTYSYQELFTPGNRDIIFRTLGMASAVTIASALIAFPLAYYMARFASPRAKGLLFLGVMLPFVHVSGDAPLEETQYFIAVKEVPIVYGSLRPDCVYVNDSAENLQVFGITGEDVRNPADLRPGCWIPAEQRELAEIAGLKIWNPSEVITLHLSRVMRRYAHEFVGIQETQAYLDFAARGMPKLVEEVTKIVSIAQINDVLQRLVQEGISIRDIKSILEALSEWGRVEKDATQLTEYVRSSLRRYISFRYAGIRETLFVHMLDPEIEDVIRGSIRRTSTGTFLSLDPNIAHDILEAIRREIELLPPTAQKPIIITDAEVRRFVRKMVELEFPELTVLSYQELAAELNIQPVGRISMRPLNNQYNEENYDNYLASPATG